MTLKAGVIGTGYLGQFHTEKYAKTKKAELVGIFDQNKTRATEVSQKCHCRQFETVEALLDSVDLVSVVVPTIHHYAVAKLALDRGVHVLVEKPITTTVEEAEELIILAKKKNLKLQVGHLEQFNPAFQHIYPQVKQPMYIESMRIMPYVKRNVDVDVLLDLMIHDIHLILMINKSPIISMDALGINILSESYDISSLHLKFKNNSIANLKVSRLAEQVVRKMRIFQRNAHFVVDFHKQSSKTFYAPKSSQEALVDMDVKDKQFKKVDQILIEIESFIDAINNDTTPEVTGEAACYALSVTLEIIEKIKKSHSQSH